MARNGSGAYSLPAGNPVVTGTTISSTVQNNTMTDIGTALTQSIAYDGQTNPVANLPMAGFKHTGVANAAARTDYAAAGQVQDSSLMWAGTAGGTANALTLTLSPAITAIAAGQRFAFKSGASPNSAATTVAISGLTAIAVQVNGAACAGGEILANSWYEILVNTTTTCQLNKIGRETLAELGAVAKAGDTMTGPLSGVTDLTTTGNTVLGNASTDTLNVGNGGIIKDASGNTGIGTTPRVKFDVGGEAAAAVHLRVVPTAGSVAGIGSFLRNDGSGTYLMLTASGDAYGTFNALRPLVVNNTTGKATLDGTATSLSTATGSAPSYSARAYVNFNGTGTVAIRTSGNVSSITDVGTGNYTANFTIAMPVNSFTVTGLAGAAGATAADTGAIRPYNYQVGSIGIQTINGAATALADYDTVNITIHC